MFGESTGGMHGGGFQSPGGFGSPQASQADTGKYRSRVNTYIPVTMSMVLKAKQMENNEKFVFDGIDFGQVTVVGIVRSVKQGNNRLDYEIDDFTAPPVEVRQFMDTDEDKPESSYTRTMRENQYVRAVGNIRAFGGKRSMVAFKISPIEDYNEVTCHILSCIQAHLRLTMPAETLNSSAMTSAGGQAQGSYAGASMPQGNLTSIQHQVQQIVGSTQADEGISVQFITQKLRGMPERAIREALEFLTNEGHIYSTIDEDHYRCTDSM